jgi:hypothetical protein
MKSQVIHIAAFVLLGLIPLQLFSQTSNKESKVKETRFTIPARGEKVFVIQVPEGVKKIRAVLSDQTEMISMDVLGPNQAVLCNTTTWSHLSNWRKPLQCSISVVNNNRQSPGTWKIKIKGAVHKGKLNKVHQVKGKLTVYFSGRPDATVKVAQATHGFPIVKEYPFTIGSRGEKTYTVSVPAGAKKIRAIISGQTEMISMDVMGPTHTTLGSATTWSNLSNWRKPLNCSVSVVNNDRQRTGKWSVKIKGAVHQGKLNKVKKVSGTLKVIVSDQ